MVTIKHVMRVMNDYEISDHRIKLKYLRFNLITRLSVLIIAFARFDMSTFRGVPSNVSTSFLS